MYIAIKQGRVGHVVSSEFFENNLEIYSSRTGNAISTVLVYKHHLSTALHCLRHNPSLRMLFLHLYTAVLYVWSIEAHLQQLIRIVYNQNTAEHA